MKNVDREVHILPYRRLLDLMEDQKTPTGYKKEWAFWGNRIVRQQVMTQVWLPVRNRLEDNLFESLLSVQQVPLEFLSLQSGKPEDNLR